MRFEAPSCSARRRDRWKRRLEVWLTSTGTVNEWQEATPFYRLPSRESLNQRSICRKETAPYVLTAHGAIPVPAASTVLYGADSIDLLQFLAARLRFMGNCTTLRLRPLKEIRRKIDLSESAVAFAAMRTPLATALGSRNRCQGGATLTLLRPLPPRQ